MDGRPFRVVPTPQQASHYSPSRVDVIKEATRRVPLNGLGLPEGFHRSDLLSEDAIRRVVSQEELNTTPQGQTLLQGVLTDSGPLLILDERLVRQAYQPLDYREGFPTLPQTGSPFWDKLDFEPPEAFKAFISYIEQGNNDGARRLFSLACQPSIQNLILPNHSNQSSTSDTGRGPDQVKPSLAPNTVNSTSGQDISLDDMERERARASACNRQLQEWFTLYYWAPRARAHDLFYLDGIRQKQSRTALQLQNEHYVDAQKLYLECMSFINGDKEVYLTDQGISRFWAEMTPRVMVDFLKTIAQFQRVSLGLPGSAPAAADSPNSVVNILRSLMQGQLNHAVPNELTNEAGPNGGRGRPAIRYDENNNPIKVQSQTQGDSKSSLARVTPPVSRGSAMGGNTPSQPQGGAKKLALDYEDEERLRRITRLMNAARARRDANIPVYADADADTPDETSPDDSEGPLQ